jgi:hypothetical protein
MRKMLLASLCVGFLVLSKQLTGCACTAVNPAAAACCTRSLETHTACTFSFHPALPHRVKVQRQLAAKCSLELTLLAYSAAMPCSASQGEFTEPALWRKQQRAASLNSSLSSSSSLLGPLQNSVANPTASSNSSSSSSSQGAAPLTYAAAAAKGLQQQQAPAVAAAAPSLGAVGVGSQLQCSGPLIKGNINSKGQKIYHTTASGSYARVEIDEKAGERYFCTEAEAQAAGWRAALK